jgi:hypothetical protein
MPTTSLAQKGKETVLFDGKDTKGWKQCGPGSMEVVDGVLVSRGGMGLFWHEKELINFVLTLDFKTSRKQDNSGVFVRFSNPGDDPFNAVKSGYEVQINDAAAGKHRTGAIYDVQESTELASKGPGEWNTLEIRCIDQNYTVKVNGRIVNQFKGEKAERGHIGLQNHDAKSTVAFRDVKVVELDRAAAEAITAADAQPAAPKPAARDEKLAPGLIGEYFKDVNGFDAVKSAKPFLVRTDKTFNHDRSDGQFYDTKLASEFVARWSGVLRIDQGGEYTLRLQSDDDGRLYIGDQLVIDNGPKPEGMKGKQAKVQLEAGDYPVRAELYNGPGGAGYIVTWKKPGAGAEAKFEPIPASSFFHDPAASEAIAWDKDAFAKATWSKREWMMRHGERYQRMDYGPFLSHTFEATPENKNTTNKGIAVAFGDHDAGIIFDTELMRYSAAWTGGFVQLKGVVFDGSHGTNPLPDGQIQFATRPEPGAVAGEPSPAAFKDPRAKPFGPLPREWTKYKGLYRNGNKVIFKYTVGDVEVLDMPAYRNDRQNNRHVFYRTFQVAPADKPISILSHLIDPAKPVSTVVGDDGATTKEVEGHVYFVLPAKTEAATYKVAVITGADQTMKFKPADDLKQLIAGGPSLWKETVETKGALGTGEGAYVVDSLTVPEKNPYNSWMRFGGLDFFSDGRAALCTWSGDVWVVSGIDDKLEKLTWKRYAAGMFQTLGLKIVDDKVYVLGRDQITRLHDTNSDGEADFYENFNNDCQVSSSFHEFSFDLQTDPEGNFYYAKAGPVRPGGRGWETITDHNGCVLKVSKDGSKFEVFATGVRAPNGMGAGPNGEITVADNEGTWMPTCRLNLVHKGDFLGVTDLARMPTTPTDYGNPICWLSHKEVDNSSGGQVWVTTDKWGPFQGQMLHMSYGKCALFKVMYETLDAGTENEMVQGGVVQFPLGFESGICRARFRQQDEQLYVAGLRGWQTTAAKDACLQRVRYTGKPVRMPTDLKIRPDGVSITFTAPLDAKAATDVENYALEQWNYVWSQEYGSPEISVADPSIKEHDPVDVESITLSEDGKTVTLMIPDLVPVMQMKIAMRLKAADGAPVEFTVYNTINKVPAAGGTTAAAAGK